MSKFDPLADHLIESGQPIVPMTFEEIEGIIGTELPPSAFRHRPWWSNNPSNSVITDAWLRAGYKSTDVDMPGRKLVFRRSAQDISAPEFRKSGPVHGDSTAVTSKQAQAVPSNLFQRIFGALNGMVTVKADTDLTEPVGTEWDAGR